MKKNDLFIREDSDALLNCKYKNKLTKMNIELKFMSYLDLQCCIWIIKISYVVYKDLLCCVCIIKGEITIFPDDYTSWV